MCWWSEWWMLDKMFLVVIMITLLEEILRVLLGV